MTNDEAKALLEPMHSDTKLAVGRAVFDSADDAAGGGPTEGFLDDVYTAAGCLIRGEPHDWQLVLDVYVDVVLADATTPEQLLAAHRKVVDAYRQCPAS